MKRAAKRAGKQPAKEIKGALVLKRNRRETVLIGEGADMIRLTVVGHSTRLAFQGPKHVRIVREEIADRPARS